MTPTTKKILGFSALALAVLGVVVYVKKKNKEEETAKPKTFYATGLNDTAATSGNVNNITMEQVNQLPEHSFAKRILKKVVKNNA